MKSRNNKSEKVMDNLSRLYQYLWNQRTLPLKSLLKSHPKYAAANRVKNIVILWMLVEKACTSTSTINLVQQYVLKADLNLKSVYGEYTELSQFFNVFMAQAKVAWEAGVHFGSEIVFGLIQAKLHK